MAALKFATSPQGSLGVTTGSGYRFYTKAGPVTLTDVTITADTPTDVGSISGFTGYTIGTGSTASIVLDVDNRNSVFICDQTLSAMASEVGTYIGTDAVTISSNVTTGTWTFTGLAVDGVYGNNGQIVFASDPIEAAKHTIKSKMKRNLLINVAQSRQVRSRLSPGEEKARRTLRDLITEQAFRRYLTNGFIMVRGYSGLFYQIFADQRHTMIYEKGQKVGELCIRTDEECPPTDHVINIKTLIEFDEPAVWAGGNRRNFIPGYYSPFDVKPAQTQIPLTGLHGVLGNGVLGGVVTDDVGLAINDSGIPYTQEPTNLVDLYKQLKRVG